MTVSVQKNYGWARTPPLKLPPLPPSPATSAMKNISLLFIPWRTFNCYPILTYEDTKCSIIQIPDIRFQIFYVKFLNRAWAGLTLERPTKYDKIDFVTNMLQMTFNLTCPKYIKRLFWQKKIKNKKNRTVILLITRGRLFLAFSESLLKITVRI